MTKNEDLWSIVFYIWLNCTIINEKETKKIHTQSFSKFHKRKLIDTKNYYVLQMKQIQTREVTRILSRLSERPPNTNFARSRYPAPPKEGNKDAIITKGSILNHLNAEQISSKVVIIDLVGHTVKSLLDQNTRMLQRSKHQFE